MESGGGMEVPVSACGHWPEFSTELECIYQAQLPCSTDQLLAMFYSDKEGCDIWDVYTRQESGLRAFLDEYKKTPWGISASNCCLERSMQMRAPSMSLPLGLASDTTLVNQVQRLHHTATGRLQHRTRAIPVEVPYAGAFGVDTRWYFQDTAAGCCVMQVFVEVVFLQSCWLSGFITARARPPAIRNTVAVAKLLADMVPQLLPALIAKEQLAPPLPTADAGDAAGTAATTADTVQKLHVTLGQLVQGMSHSIHKAHFTNNPAMTNKDPVTRVVWPGLPLNICATLVVVDVFLLLHTAVVYIRGGPLLRATQGLLHEAQGLSAILSGDIESSRRAAMDNLLLATATDMLQPTSDLPVAVCPPWLLSGSSASRSWLVGALVAVACVAGYWLTTWAVRLNRVPA